MWIFEPHVAEAIFEDYVREFKIPVQRDHWLDARRRGEGRRADHVDPDARRLDLARPDVHRRDL